MIVMMKQDIRLPWIILFKIYWGIKKIGNTIKQGAAEVAAEVEMNRSMDADETTKAMTLQIFGRTVDKPED